MEALINDHQSQELDILLIQEPSITTYRTHVNQCLATVLTHYRY